MVNIDQNRLINMLIQSEEHPFVFLFTVSHHDSNRIIIR